MRIALLADIHGNSIALDAVMRHLSRNGDVDECWVLGDLVALGPDPIGVLDRLSKIPAAKFVRGNTDRYAAHGDRPGPTVDEVRSNPDLMRQLVEVANTFAWTQGMVTGAGWLDWLRALPLEVGSALPDGTSVLCVHASPGLDDGSGVAEKTGDPEVERLLGACRAELICVGHTHVPLDRTIGRRRIVNPGAVSLSATADRSASYAVLEADENGHRVRHARVPYDRAAVIGQLHDVNHPARDFLIRHLADPRD